MAHRGHAGHHHDHGSHGAVGNIKIAFFLNLIFTVIEIFGGIFTNSVAILTDALHDLGDSLSLGLSWYLEKVASKNPDKDYSYGYARFSVLGAFINSMILVIGSVLLLSETIPRLLHPQPSDALGMVGFAVVGVLVNGAAVFRLKKGETLNERVVALHLMEDVLGWVAILIGSIVMLFVDVPILDPLMSLGILAFVLYNVFNSLKQSSRIFLQGIPREINLSEVERELLALEGVVGIHDMHLWTLDGQYNVATMHMAVARPVSLADAESVKDRAREVLENYEIVHATIEVETCDADCDYIGCKIS
ncbi:MAG TPA: cation transporter [Bacteroidetes bacterium]|nr:cation transporter [Bacteroidota bacterium]